ncbi:MAG: lactate racemase domain-containing protein [Blastocatellia bacterium]
MIVAKGVEDGLLSEGEIRDLVEASLLSVDLDGKRLLIIIPDRTRTAPIPLMFRLFNEVLGPRVRQMDYLIALGTHRPLGEDDICQLLGLSADERQTKYAGSRVFNHEWERPETFVSIGRIGADEVRALSDGLVEQPIDVRINKLIFDYDHLIVCGPTFPHEVAGFSGGNKYFFPGISGQEVIDTSHWLGARLTNYSVIGTKCTPVRRLIDRAASLIDRPKLCFSLVVKDNGLAGLFAGTPEEAYGAAADLSASVHVRWTERPFRRVLSVMPPMYEDIWTAAKGMYKVEPAVDDGGEVVIYAPHIREISHTHGADLERIGYHVRDYFLKQWEKFKHVPGGVLAHSTHLRGLGEYDAVTGIEKPRVKVTLATAIPEGRCRRVNLDYLDPGSINLDQWRGREDEGILLIPKAGEILYKVRAGAVDAARA